MRKYLLFFLLITGVLPWSLCYADTPECHFSDGGGSPASVSYNNVELGTALDKDTPIGTIIYDSAEHSTLSSTIVCNGSVPYQEGYRTNPSAQVGSDKCLFELPLTDGSDSGLGIKIYYDLRNSSTNPGTYCLQYPPNHSTANRGDSGFQTEGNIRIVIQVIGELHGGTINLARFNDNGIWWADLLGFTINFTNVYLDVSARTCDIDTPDIPVSLSPTGGVNTETTFTGVNSTSDSVPFNIELSCDPGVDVAIRFEGETQNSSQNTILKLTDQDNSATGVGVQILDNNKNIMIFNQPGFTLQTTDVQQPQISLPFSARYIQTSSQITGGKADAEATFFLSFP